MNNEKNLRIVIVEDEPELRDNLIIGLTSHGLDVRGAANGIELDAALADQAADIVLLDLGLPGEDGLKIAERLRSSSKTGVIILTARGLIADRILGLESGADSYFVKPVDITELAAAIKSLGRRLEKPAAIHWKLNAECSRLYSPNGISISLTAQECLLMSLMISNIGRNVTRAEIFQAIGQPPNDAYSNPRLEVLISRLRSKVHKADPAEPLPLRARHNIGYIFLSEDM